MKIPLPVHHGVGTIVMVIAIMTIMIGFNSDIHSMVLALQLPLPTTLHNRHYHSQNSITTPVPTPVETTSNNPGISREGVETVNRRRRNCVQSLAAVMTLFVLPVVEVPSSPRSPLRSLWESSFVAHAAEFAPGGTLISDKAIGILVNNPNASPQRKYDNRNVLFDKDYYYKFGTGIQYIEPPGNTAFPKTMPFTKSQQRYDALKKYRERITSALQLLQSLPKTTTSSTSTTTNMADPKGKEDVYQLRAMGLLANGLLASDNNGLPNEVFVARYYINEIYLRLDELYTTSRSGSSSSGTNDDENSQQRLIYQCIEKATNSYLTLMNRAITPKVGEPFPYVQLV
jgi:energy-converting hydrogenase Eha subunit A